MCEFLCTKYNVSVSEYNFCVCLLLEGPEGERLLHVCISEIDRFSESGRIFCVCRRVTMSVCMHVYVDVMEMY